MKASLIKTIEEGENVDLALLTYKTTPPSHRLTITSRIAELQKIQDSTTDLYSTNKTAGELQTDMDQGKQIQALYNRNTRVLPRLEQSQKVVVQLDPDKNIWMPAEVIQCPTNEGRSYSLRTIHDVYTRNRRFIKLDLTAAELAEPKPINEPKVTRPTRTIRKPDRLIKSK